MAEENKDEIPMFKYCPGKGKYVPAKEEEETTKAKAASTNQSEQDLIMNYIKERIEKRSRFRKVFYQGNKEAKSFNPRKIHSSFQQVREDIANRKSLG